MPQFERYIGVDYSGAETAESRLKGLRIYTTKQDEEPYEVLPQVHPSLGHRKYWTRRGIGEWLASEPQRTFLRPQQKCLTCTV